MAIERKCLFIHFTFMHKRTLILFGWDDVRSEPLLGNM